MGEGLVRCEDAGAHGKWAGRGGGWCGDTAVRGGGVGPLVGEAVVHGGRVVGGGQYAVDDTVEEPEGLLFVGKEEQDGADIVERLAIADVLVVNREGHQHLGEGRGEEGGGG